MDPSLTDDTSKKREADGELPSRDDQRDTTPSSAKRKVGSILNVSKKQQNSMLLLNAMKTTSIHSNTSFSFRALEIGIDNASAETLRAGSGGRSSITPVPAATRGETPKGVASPPTPQEPAAKAPAGGGKKKRKRERIVMNGVTRVDHDAAGTSL
jgi:mediator of RNA polymerase II transcription subunit 6